MPKVPVLRGTCTDFVDPFADDGDSTPPPECVRIQKVRQHGQTLPEALPWIVERVRSGWHINHACEAAGFSRQALYGYCKRNPEVAMAMQQAKAEGEGHLVETLQEKAKSDAYFGLMVLERRRPDEWGKTEKVEHSGPGGGAIKIDVSSLSDAELDAELAKIGGGT